MNAIAGRARSPTAHGFTLVEVVVAIAIGTILLSMALRGLGGASSRLAVRGAAQSFKEFESRARSYAIEHGTLTRFRVDPTGDSIWIEAGSGRIAVAKVGEEQNVDIQSSGSSVVTLCLNPRGFGETGCNSFSSSVNFSFVQGDESTSLTLLPLGLIR